MFPLSGPSRFGEARLDAAAAEITPDEVYEEEARTQHNVRALVNVLKRHLPPEVRPFVHLGATSVDILDTAAALRYRDAVLQVILPVLLDLQDELIRKVRDEAETPQIGRTHGQHAVPITFGFAMAEYVARLGKSIQRIHEKAGGAARQARRRRRRLQRDLPAREGSRAAGAGVSAPPRPGALRAFDAARRARVSPWDFWWS